MGATQVIRVLLTILFAFVYLVTSAPYVPGEPGGPWTDQEISIVREKVLQVLNQKHYVHSKKLRKKGCRDCGAFMKKDSLLWKDAVKNCNKDTGCEKANSQWFMRQDMRRPMASKFIRLAFHDCVKNIDSEGNHVGGCDGCLNYDGMGHWMPEAWNPTRPVYKYKIPTHGSNNDLQFVVKALELVYTNASWPSMAPTLPISLRESGKSRADVWQFAANVALEQEIERANYACEYNQYAQQVGVLEGKDKCLIKLHKPITFQYGRADCISDESKKITDLPYEQTDKETPYNPHGTSTTVLDTLKEDFGFTAEESISLMATHSTNFFGADWIEATKYKWIGNHLSNMYFKFLASTPTFEAGPHGSTYQGQPTSFVLVGDTEGNPVDGTRWIPICHKMWNSTKSPDGGPCHFRPTSIGCAYGKQYSVPPFCLDGFDAAGKLV